MQNPETAGFKKHWFICTAKKATGESCGAKGSELLRAELKKACAGMDGVRINTSGCLDHCERGIAAVLYPEGHWELGLKPTDMAKLKALIE